MSLLQRLKAGTENKNRIKFPGTEEDVKIGVLSDAERQSAHFETERLFKKNEIEPSMVTVEAYESEKTTQLLYRALTDTDGNPSAKDIDEFRALITKDEKDILVDEYESWEMECSPSPRQMTDAELDEIIEALKKRPEEILGSVLSITTAKRLIISLANRLATLQTDSGSTS